MKKPTLTSSKMKTFTGCPRRYRYEYVDRIQVAKGVALVFGSCFHEALELNYAQKVSTETDLPVEEVVEKFRDRFTDQAPDAELPAGETVGRLLDLGCKMVATHHQKIAPTVMPLYVEKPFRVSLGEEFPFDLSGRWDLVDVDAIIVDNKSYKSAPKQEWVDTDIQMSTYSLAYRLQFNECENGLRIDAVTKSRTPQVVQCYTRRTNDDAAWLIGQIEGIAKAILAGTDYPRDDGNNLCTPVYCPYWQRCKKERRY
jgi:hypothetical protein